MKTYLDELEARYPVLKGNIPAIGELISDMIALYRSSGTFFVAGNGGSGADAEHICGELLKGFCRKRPLGAEDLEKLKQCGDTGSVPFGTQLQNGLRAVSLLSHPALTTAFGNDVDADLAFAQQLWSLGRSGDIFLGISTGGNAANIRKAFITARAKNIKTCLLTGNRHGCCEEFADIVIAVPEKETYRIQELHLPIYHTVCLAVEAEFFKE
ncbi:MAG: SIS domain-containing protein [Lentisphaeria bacterium]|nr:SIS domain-containing protein [Lentisphaeria bacterium]